MTTIRRSAHRLTACVLLAWLNLPAMAAEPWPGFRGPAASGQTAGARPPTTWNVETGENLKWKVPVPGLGLSCPVVWGDRVYLTTAINTAVESDPLKVGLYGDIWSVPDDSVHRFDVLCLDRATGRVLWQRTAHQGVPQIKRHTKASHANATPATDGRHVVAFFGSEGLYCYDAEGDLKWKRDFGRLDSGFYMMPLAQWGFGSSPVIHDDLVIVQCDVQQNSFLAVLKLSDGTDAWRVARTDVPTWSTPAVDRGTAQIIVNGYRHIGGYDLLTGKERWRLEGGGDIPVPTPIIGNGLVYITSAHGPMAPVYAVRLDSVGTLKPNTAAIPWHVTKGGAYMQTPLLYDEWLFSCRDNGVLTCFDARTGDVLFRSRLGDGMTGFTASPVAAAGHLYFTSEQGEVYVVAAKPEFEVVATNALGEVSMATPAISGDTLLFRGQKHLIAIAPRPTVAPTQPIVPPE